ncbi:hypothetical protein F4778DRAFT_783364 [Xylariomycetidae sp. FL2044]|nr:hypothetical protein F4778DRAFT_783364 [Xylariomycetidae sp. FL2044]
MAAGHPTTGYPNTYDDDDERNYSAKFIHNEQKHHNINVEGYMPKDRTKAVDKMLEEDATSHGREPSKGAKIDAELQAEDEAIIRKKAAKTDSLPGKK